MKAGYLIIIFAAFTAACTPRFYPPRVSVPDDYIYGRGFSEDLSLIHISEPTRPY